MMKTYKFKIQGSATEPYNIQVEILDENINIFCNCDAGIAGKSCKHKLQVLYAKDVDAIDGDIEHLQEINKMFINSPIAVAHARVNEILEQQEQLKKTLTSARKALDKSMRSR